MLKFCLSFQLFGKNYKKAQGNLCSRFTVARTNFFQDWIIKIIIISVTIPFTTILVYHGADCIANKSGYVLYSQNTYIPRTIKTPINKPIIIFKKEFNFGCSLLEICRWSYHLCPLAISPGSPQRQRFMRLCAIGCKDYLYFSNYASLLMPNIPFSMDNTFSMPAPVFSFSVRLFPLLPAAFYWCL